MGKFPSARLLAVRWSITREFHRAKLKEARRFPPSSQRNFYPRKLHLGFVTFRRSETNFRQEGNKFLASDKTRHFTGLRKFGEIICAAGATWKRVTWIIRSSPVAGIASRVVLIKARGIFPGNGEFARNAWREGTGFVGTSGRCDAKEISSREFFSPLLLWCFSMGHFDQQHSFERLREPWSKFCPLPLSLSLSLSLSLR